MRELALMIAVAMGTDAALARQRLDAAFPLPAAPAPGDVTGHRVERITDANGVTMLRTVELRGDGSERLKSVVPDPNAPAPGLREAKEPEEAKA